MRGIGISGKNYPTEKKNKFQFTDTEKFELFALVAGVMHMGEMRFKQRPREEQAEVDDVKGWNWEWEREGMDCKAFDSFCTSNINSSFSMIAGDVAAKLFGDVDPEKFVTAILRPRVKVGAEWVNKGQNLEQVG